MSRFLNNTFKLLAISGLILLNSCGPDGEPPDATLPEATGTVQISFLNFPGAGDVTTTAAAGDVVSVAVQVQKSPNGNRPQKLRVYETNARNTRGTQFGPTIDLRNTEDAQIKNVNYTVPQNSSSTIYLYFEVDESASAFSRKLLIINVGGAGINSYTGLVLGGQTNRAASRVASSTGQLYFACDAAANIDDIDITYASIGSPTANPTIMSNPERARQGLSTTATNCGENASTSTAGGPATVFAVVTGVDFNAANDASLEALTVAGTAQLVTVRVNDIVAFRRADGRKGLIRVNSFPDGTGVGGTVNIDVKVQR